MKKKIWILSLTTATAFTLFACGSEANDSEAVGADEEVQDLIISDDWEGEEADEETLDLTGTWTSDPEDGTWMEAIIEGDTLTINFVLDDGAATEIYWVGTYTAPEAAADTYRFESVRDEEKMKDLPRAATESSMEITYEADALHFDVTEEGETKNVELICG